MSEPNPIPPKIIDERAAVQAAFYFSFVLFFFSSFTLPSRGPTPRRSFASPCPPAAPARPNVTPDPTSTCDGSAERNRRQSYSQKRKKNKNNDGARPRRFAAVGGAKSHRAAEPIDLVFDCARPPAATIDHNPCRLSSPLLRACIELGGRVRNNNPLQQ